MEARTPSGRAGDHITDEHGRFPDDLLGRIGAAATVVVIANLALIAGGSTFSPAVEVVAVALFTVAVAGLAVGVFLRLAPRLPWVPGSLLAVGSLVLFVTMALALTYGYSAFPETGRLVTIGDLIAWHGTLNAFGFTLPALVALRLLSSPE